MKIWPQIDLIMLNTLTCARIWLNLTVFEIYAKNYCLTPMFYFLVKEAMFFDGSEIPTWVLCTIPQGTFIPSLVPISKVVSEENSFEKLLTDDIGRRRQQTPSNGISSYGLRPGELKYLKQLIYTLHFTDSKFFA